MKHLLSALLLGSLSVSVSAQDAYTFDLSNPDQVKKQLTVFVKALHEKDTATEFKFRDPDFTYWRYKSMLASPDIIEHDASFSEIGFLSKITFGDILVDTINHMIMRTHYTEPDNKKNKHRYAFHVDENGKIDQVLYVPPITAEYFPEWEEEDFQDLAARLDTATNYTDEIEPETYEFEMWSCGGVMPEIEEMIAEDMELSDEEIKARKELTELNEADIMENEEEQTPNKEVTPKDLNSRMNR